MEEFFCIIFILAEIIITIIPRVKSELTTERYYIILFGVTGAMGGYLIAFVLGSVIIILYFIFSSMGMNIFKSVLDQSLIWQNLIPPLLRASPLLIISGSVLGLMTSYIQGSFEWSDTTAHKWSVSTSAITGIILSTNFQVSTIGNI
jgi:hypothetical protein